MDFFANINIQFYLLAYLIGGIPFGFILAKIFAGVNIKESGSGNIGATNVLRVVKAKDEKLGKKLAAATLALDAIKGAALILLGKAIGLSPETQWAIAFFSVLGHCFSPFLKFEGGKGVATGFGVFMVLLPLESLIALGVWFGVGKILKISSLSSLAGLMALVALSFLLHQEIPSIGTHAPIVMIAIVVLYKHIPNILRLFSGAEAKVI